MHYSDFEKLTHALGHDLSPEPPPPRPPLPRKGRLLVIAYLLGTLVLTGVVLANIFSAVTREAAALDLSKQREAIEVQSASKETEIKGYVADTNKAEEIASWVRIGYHAQKLIVDVLGSFNDRVVLEQIQGKMSPGLLQLELSFTLEGLPEAQVEAMGSLEATLFAQGIRIANREVPSLGFGGRGQSYRLILLLPDTLGGAGQMEAAR